MISYFLHHPVVFHVNSDSTMETSQIDRVAVGAALGVAVGAAVGLAVGVLVGWLVG
jgi:hypothetical protein